MTGRTFLDTNVLVYAFDSQQPAKQATAQAVPGSPDAQHYVLSAQVLGEFYVTVTRKLAVTLGPDDAAAAVDRFARLRVQQLDAELVRQASSTSQTAHISYRDALVIEAAVRAGCARVLSEDLHDGQTISGVRIVNPFA